MLTSKGISVREQDQLQLFTRVASIPYGSHILEECFDFFIGVEKRVIINHLGKFILPIHIMADVNIVIHRRRNIVELGGSQMLKGGIINRWLSPVVSL